MDTIANNICNVCFQPFGFFNGVGVAEKMRGYKSLGTNQRLHSISSKEEAALKGTRHGQRSQKDEKQEQHLYTPEDSHVRIPGTVEDRAEGAGESEGGRGLTP